MAELSGRSCNSAVCRSAQLLTVEGDHGKDLPVLAPVLPGYLFTLPFVPEMTYYVSDGTLNFTHSP